MKCIVTGGAGFIGSHLVDRLIKFGHDVIVFDNLLTGKVENLNPEAQFRQVDISEWDELLLAEDDFKKCDVIFHNAASKKTISGRDPSMDLQINGNGTLTMLQLAVKHHIKRFIHASTGSVIGIADDVITEESPLNPVSYYGVSKLAGEKYVRIFDRLFDINCTVLRYYHVIGNRQDSSSEGGVCAIFKRLIIENKPITIFGDGNQTRLFTHVSDVVKANINAWQNLIAHGQVYNVANDQQVTINEMAYKLMTQIGNRVEIIYKDPVPDDIYYFMINNRKVREHLDITFLPFSDSIKKI